ncbi:MAG: hypothetical protein KAW09_05745 [Thermoplasmata archaeon]|nr:hypothetical protein [Thermoplasmata archaeon]
MTEHERRLEHVSGQENGLERAILKPWQEIVGNLKQVSVKGESLEVQIATKTELVRLSLERSSSECERIHGILLNCPAGSLVGVLRTDSKSNPILIRRISE